MCFKCTYEHMATSMKIPFKCRLLLAFLLCHTGVQSDFHNLSVLSYNGFNENGTIPPLGSPPNTPKSALLPYVDEATAVNVSAFLGKSAFLSCRVRNLGNKSVSWIRHRDIHILTLAGYTYTSDQRFGTVYHPEFEDWTLQIKWTQKRDGGVYECQINTQPVISYFVLLTIVVPTATILGGSDLFVAEGSTINVTCLIRFSGDPTAYIFWYHDDELISYDSSRGGVSVITEKGDITTSLLLIQKATARDSGTYLCSPSNADMAVVRVHVLNGERPAAMQTGAAGLSNNFGNMVIIMLLAYSYARR